MESRTYPTLAGKTISELRIEPLETESEDRERLTIVFTDASEFSLETQDYEGYRSWLKDIDP